MASAIRIPSATYRLQLRREFPLDAATGVVSYLRQLGISDLYLSPLYAARKGSSHGYDVVDHATLNRELGTSDDLCRLFDDVHASEMGVILDIVPNHMCISDDANQAWMDVLESGRDAASAAQFDIDWDPPKMELIGKVLLPILGEQYGHALEAQQLSVHFDTGQFFLLCNEHRLPLAPPSWRHLLEPALETLRSQVPADDAGLIELESILRAVVETLPPLRAAGRDRSVEFCHEKQAIRLRLAGLTAGQSRVLSAITDVVSAVNGVRGQPDSFNRLERLMNDQYYRLAHWRVAAHEVNYRRFFDVNDLAAVRVETPSVFKSVHALPFEIARHRAFCGFRIDHVDGLADPEQYLADLASHWNDRCPTPGVSPIRPYVVVEKILGTRETLPASWIADGTTGYDFIALLAGVFVRAEGRTRLRATAEAFGALPATFEDMAYQSKRLVLQTTLAAELTVLGRHLDRISEQHRTTRDFTLNHLQAALGEIIACFPVYRTYVRRDCPSVTDRDASIIAGAVAAARRRNPLINASLFVFIESVLLHQDPVGLDEAQLEERRIFVTRFQQLTGPVVAKGIEDTAFYRYLPLVALNEIGGDPERWGTSLLEVHHALAIRGAVAPHTLSATATHDTKRGEDTRARLYILSEVADVWAATAQRWSDLTAGYKTNVDGVPAPDAAEEYLLYQTLVATWPLGGWQSEPGFADRIRAYMSKARREAKIHTSWINPHPSYDAAAEAFVDAVLDPGRSATLLDEVDAFARTIMMPGLWNGLSQVVLKIAAPGVPDFLQGTELWDFSLVDPDNRRLIDFECRRNWLAGMSAEVEAAGCAPVASWFNAPEDGRIKLWVSAAGLRFRRARRRLFEQGDYQPLTVIGDAAEHVLAFARTTDNDASLAIVGRFFATLGAAPPTGSAWGDTRLMLPPTLSGRRFRDCLAPRLLTAEADALPLATVFRHLPVALLETVS